MAKDLKSMTVEELRKWAKMHPSPMSGKAMDIWCDAYDELARRLEEAQQHRKFSNAEVAASTHRACCGTEHDPKQRKSQEGSCNCPNAQDTKRYRELRRMVGPIVWTIGEPLHLPEGKIREPHELRADLDAELDLRIARENSDPSPEEIT